MQAKEKKGLAKYDESKGARGGGGADDTPLDDPVAEKLRQQRLIEEADYQATMELFGSGRCCGGWDLCVAHAVPGRGAARGARAAASPNRPAGVSGPHSSSAVGCTACTSCTACLYRLVLPAGKELDGFIPKSLKDFEELGKLVAARHLLPHARAAPASYKAAIKSLLKVALATMAAQEVKDLETCVAGGCRAALTLWTAVHCCCVNGVRVWVCWWVRCWRRRCPRRC